MSLNYYLSAPAPRSLFATRLFGRVCRAPLSLLVFVGLALILIAGDGYAQSGAVRFTQTATSPQATATSGNIAQHPVMAAHAVQSDNAERVLPVAALTEPAPQMEPVPKTEPVQRIQPLPPSPMFLQPVLKSNRPPGIAHQDSNADSVHSVDSVIGGETRTAPPVEQSAATITLATIESRATAVANNAELDEDARKRVAGLYETARGNLSREAQFERRRGDFRQGLESAEQRSNHIRISLAQLQSARPTPPKTEDVGQLEELLNTQRDSLDQLKERKVQLDQLSRKRAARRSEICRRLSDLECEIPYVRDAAAAPPNKRESAPASLARNTEALCHLRSCLMEKPALEEELRYFDAEAASNLLQSERELIVRQVDLWSEQLQLTESALQVARDKEAGAAIKFATAAGKQVPDILRPLAAENIRYAKRIQDILELMDAAQSELKHVKSVADVVEESSGAIQAKVDAVGLPSSVGTMLRRARSHLPSRSVLKSSRIERQKLMESAQLELLDLDEQLGHMHNVSREVERQFALLGIANTTAASAENARVAAELLTARREIMKTVYRDQSTYFNTLVELSIEEEQLGKLADEFSEYIDERVLWIRSHPPLYTDFTRENWKAELESKRGLMTWPEIGPSLLNDAATSPLLYSFYLGALGLLFVSRPLFSAQLRRIAGRARGSAYSSFSPSLMALLINITGSLFLPGCFLFLAWRLSLLRNPQPCSNAIAAGCLDCAFALLPLTFFRNVFAKDGLADAHFDWHPHVTQSLRRQLSWLSVVLVPFVFVGAVLYSIQETSGHGIIHRCMFIVASFSIALFVWRILNRNTGLARDFLSHSRGGWIERLHPLWFWAIVATPVALALLTAWGYTYTANELAWRGFLTLAIVGLAFIFHGLFMRLILVHRRNLSIDAAREHYAEYNERPAEPVAERQHEVRLRPGPDESLPENVIADLPGASVNGDGIVLEEDPIADLQAKSAQSRRLVTTMLVGAAALMIWMTWHHVLPALTLLEQWPVWNSTQIVTEVITTDSGVAEPRAHEIVDPVTIAEVFLSIVVIIIGAVAARDLPGLLELIVLKHLPLENSVRYAITTICSYALFLIGLMFSCRLIGLHWHQIQWMATAFTFGLAFGLQEMFANFVAGIIILLERPIRVGDIVTIDKVTGVVSKVRMRATTVTNFDRKDFIVPNKDFITGRLLNWTLSDQVNRILVKVGVAYGSDTGRAKQLMQDTARIHPIVVDDPAPKVTFDEFGDSSLNLVLRCFISMENMPMRLDVIDELHCSIDAAFRKEKIEIAFPQQDIYIRDLPAAIQSRAA